MSQINEKLIPREQNLVAEQTVYDKAYVHNPLLRESKNTKGSSSMIISLLKNVKLGADLTSFASPVQFDSGHSNLHVHTDTYKPTEALYEFMAESDPAKRMLYLVKHCISNFVSLVSNTFVRSKPMNPILAEQNHCHWVGKDGSIFNYVSEQVSHHPPISALYMRNDTHKLEVTASLETKVTFKGNSVDVDHRGHRCISHPNPKTGVVEHYMMDGPSGQGTGIFLGSARFGFNNTMHVTCPETDTIAIVKFSGVTQVKGKVKVKSKPTAKKHDVKVYRFTGDMLNKLTLETMETKKTEDFLVLSQMEFCHNKYKPVADMGPLESRRVWHNVFYLLEQENIPEAQRHKHIVEEKQRDLRKQRKKSGEVFVPALFVEQKESPNGVMPYWKPNEKAIALLGSTVMDDAEDVDEDDLD